MKTVLVLVNTDRNFTPRDLMAIAARQHANMTFVPGLWSAMLIIDGRPYRIPPLANLQRLRCHVA